jgi:glycosyltransferase involved in cell wall biosynthesis
MIKDYISIVVPCYNAAAYISETIYSILKQSHSKFELIIINDGSTDHSVEIISEIKDPRITVIHQSNQGVSVTRNNGLKVAKGEYIIFFDADDLMTDKFLHSRISVLKTRPDIHGIGGKIIAFNLKNKNIYNAVCPSENAISEILLYKSNIATCPSNYLFKHDFIKQNNILFNTNLQSTADRFFLLECSKTGKLFYSREIAELHYRISESSMSGTLNYALLNDNIKYFNILNASHIIPNNIKTECMFLHYYIFAGSFFKLKNYLLGIKYLLLCFFKSPKLFLKKFCLKNNTLTPLHKY